MSNKNLIISSTDKQNITDIVEIKINQMINSQPMPQIIIPIKAENRYFTENIGGLNYLKIAFEVMPNVDKLQVSVDTIQKNRIIINSILKLEPFFYTGIGSATDIIINDVNYHNYYFTFKDDKIIPYFDVYQHASDIKHQLNSIKIILEKIKFLFLKMASHNIPIMQVYTDYLTTKIKSPHYNLTYDFDGTKYPYIKFSFDPATADEINKTNKYIYENIPICVLPYYSTQHTLVSLSDNTKPKYEIKNISIGSYDLNAKISKDIPYTEYYTCIVGIINHLTELKIYIQDALIITTSKTIDEEIKQFKKFLEYENSGLVWLTILYNGANKYIKGSNNTTTDININDNIDKKISFGQLNFFVDTDSTVNILNILTLEKLHDFINSINDSTKTFQKTINKIESSIYLLNNIHKLMNFDDYNIEIEASLDAYIQPSEFDNGSSKYPLTYHNYCFYIFKNMFRYPTLSFKKSSNEILIENLTYTNKTKLLSLFFLVLDGLLVLNKKYNLEVTNTSTGKQIIQINLLIENHELNLMDQINENKILHQLSSIALKESVIGQHGLYNLVIDEDSNKKLHNVGPRTEYFSKNDDFYKPILYPSTDISTLNKQMKNKSSYETKLTENIIDLYDKLKVIDLTDDLKLYIDKYLIEYEYVPINLSF